tara:strand:- start:169 stop:1554 length:1386 start_codon:yes stop_codon:yes gene_type:complete
MAKNFKIAGGHRDTVSSAENILKSGGNAFDAAISGVFSSMVCEYLYTGAASGGAMMVQKNGFSPSLIDFFVETPRSIQKNVGDFKTIYADFGDTKQEFNIGAGSVGVPGTIPGLIEIHKRYGSLPFSVLVEQSVHLAKKGSVISKNQEYLSSVLSPVISNSPELLSLFKKDGSFLRAGERFFNKELGLFLEQFLYEDPTVFYKNEVCPLFYDTISEGGIISLKDLQDYTPKKRRPLAVKYRGCDIFMNPKPSTGGVLIKEGLKSLSKIKNVSKKDVEAALFAINLLKDRDAVGSTTHLTVIDHEKNVASATTTNGVGAGFIIPKTGIMPNNMLGEKHLNPHGFHAWKSKQRIPSNVCPTLVLGGRRGVVALGSAGSSRIISAILSVITNMLDYKMSLVDAVSSPRIHVEDGILHCEPDSEKPKYRADEVVSWGDKNMYFGGVNACSFSESVGDERRDSVSV